jgi:hypothetical protein
MGELAPMVGFSAKDPANRIASYLNSLTPSVQTGNSIQNAKVDDAKACCGRIE